MKSKVLSIYTLQGTLVLLLSLVWGGLVGCSPSNTSSPNDDGGNFLTVGLNLRAQEDNKNTLNKDLQDEEDKVHELRIMLFQGGDLKYNLCYCSSPRPTTNNGDFPRKLGQTATVFAALAKSEERTETRHKKK